MRLLCAFVVVGVLATSIYAAPKTGFQAFIAGNPGDACRLVGPAQVWPC